MEGVYIIVRVGLIGDADTTLAAFTDQEQAEVQLARLVAADPDPFDYSYRVEFCPVDDVEAVDWVVDDFDGDEEEE